MGILPSLAIMAKLRHFHQVVNHLLIGFQESWPCWEMLGGALSGAALIQRAGGGEQQGKHWANLWNVTFCFGHLLGFLLCPRWPTAMLFYRNLLLSMCEMSQCKLLMDCTSGIIGKHGPREAPDLQTSKDLHRWETTTAFRENLHLCAKLT